ncbi:hypothetical protein D018_3224B, partial [Vibrio parahaemolyticus VP2007-007]
VPKTKKIISYR